MKIPVSPPAYQGLFLSHGEELLDLVQRRIGPEVKGQYMHWHELRYQTPPEGLTHEQWWLAIKIARSTAARDLPLYDKKGKAFRIALTDSIASKLHTITREASGSLRGLDQTEDDKTKERFLLRSQMEEAITSSQLEGAGTTLAVAKDMLRSGRKPRDFSERMIHNNYQAMQALKQWRDEPLTPQRVFEIHRLLTLDTLDKPEAAGRFRTSDENIVVHDGEGRVLHEPPPADELPARLQSLCDFANGIDQEGFVHPVIRAIAIHFQIGYDHPFYDGNGRTARTLFYWSMLRSDYWLAEYLSVSTVFRKAKGQYLRSYLYTETDESDLGYFVDHHLEVIVQAIDGLHGYLKRKTEERKRAQSLLKPTSAYGAKLNHRQRELLMDAVRHPDKQYRIDEHQGAHGVTYQTARTDLLSLARLGLLRSHRQGRAFVFLPIDGLADRLKQ